MKANNYIQINVIDIKQLQTGKVVVGKLKFSELLDIHRLTERKESQVDPFELGPIDINKEDEEFQRQLSQNKLTKIANYLKDNFNLLKEEKAIGLFPTSIILALKHDIDYDPKEINTQYLEKIYDKDLSNCFINEDEKLLFIPRNKRIALIVDGQHRFYGVYKFYNFLSTRDDKEIIENFEFVTSFLIGFEIYDIGKTFATVNFTQKPVNRSLYYDIFGSVPDIERNEIKLAHDLALHLNNNDKSPIKGMIKMLGKGYGLFSQAFIVEKILIHFRKNGVWEKIYSDYLTAGKEYKKLPTFFRVYLNCVKDKFSIAWPKPNNKYIYTPFKYDFVLCKTTGMGAILRLIKDIYPLVENLPEEVMYNTINSIFNNFSGNAERLFSREDEFGGAGSEGLQVKLYKELRREFKLD